MSKRPKRGTDHYWKTIQYKDNCAVYARCKCGFEFHCGRRKHLEDGTWSFKEYPEFMYLYCPQCGARKKYYNETPEKIDGFSWDNQK